jgi:ferredoxin
MNEKKSNYILIIDCKEKIPCNPCESACPKKIINIGSSITNLPELKDSHKCTGCGNCVASCPGQAIFLVNVEYSDNFCSFTFPYEFNKIPDVGQYVKAVDGNGTEICKAKVISVKNNKRNNRTILVTILIPKEKYESVKGIKKL